MSDGVGHQLRHGVEPRVDRRHVDQRRGQPIGQQPGAERRDRAVHHAQQRAVAAAVADRRGQFKAAPRGGVDGKPLVGRVGQQPVDVGERGLLRLREVIEHGPGGAQRGGVGRFGSKPKPSSERVPNCFGQRLDRRLLGEASRRAAA